MSHDSLTIAIYTGGLPISGEDPVELSLGGSETAGVSMAGALQRLEHTVTVFCNVDGARRVAGVSYVPRGELEDCRADEPWDVFLSCRGHDVLERPVKARLIGMWNHDEPSESSVAYITAALPKTAFSFFLSRFHMEEFEKQIAGISRRSRVTTNGVDFAALGRIAEEASGGKSALRFLYGSHWDRGLDYLLEKVWPALKVEYPRAELLYSTYDMSRMSMSDEMRARHERCEQLIRTCEDVRFMGYLTRRQFWHALATCHAVLYPTDHPESSCMVALEAQAMGVPIVTTGRFALRETVGFKETLVDEPWASRQYLESFLGKLRRLVDDEDFYRRARQAGERHVTRESHSWETIAGDWTAFFNEELHAP